jgi:hypothetical protein
MPFLGRGVAHGFQHHLQEHRLELLGGVLHGGARVLLGQALRLRQAVDVDGELICDAGLGHGA